MEEGVYAAVDRYHDADSHGTRGEVLAILTLDSPKRGRYSGSDEDFAISREALNASNYLSQALNKRDLKINGDSATLVADKHTTRDDVPIPIVGKGLLYELTRVDGTWLIYDTAAMSCVRRPRNGRDTRDGMARSVASCRRLRRWRTLDRGRVGLRSADGCGRRLER